MKLGWKERLSSKKSELKLFFKTPSPLIREEKTNNLKSEFKSIRFPVLVAIEANEGDAIAQLELGKAYYNTTLVGSNIDKVFGWIYRSAEQGNMEAQFRLGELYALGHGTSKSPSDAYKWYTKSAIQGYKKALIRIHNLYQEDTKMHCRGQINSAEKEWADDDFKRKNGIRELNEYRLQQKKHILNGAISYYTKQFKTYQSSNQEDPNTQLNLAFLYQHGYGVKKCIRWAFKYYTLAAENGNTEAQYNLGNLYQKHTKMKFNYRHAFKWLTKSAQGGNRIAQRCLAYFYLKGLSTDIDYGVARSWYTKAAEAGDSEAMVTLGKLYRKGDYIKQDLQMAAHWYTLGARQSNIVAQNCLSQLQQRGMLDNIQLEEDVLEYLTESSMNNRLCTKLCTDVSKLRNVPNFKRLNELAKCALIGYGQAMYEVGLKYLKGDNDFIQDEDAGRKWIKNAANAKHKDAQLLIAEMYKDGDSVEQDYHKAAIWYKTLAKQKDAVARRKIGAMYNEGIGVRQDPLEASKWFIWAADQGNSGAQYNLAMLRLEGRGLHQDKEEALELLNASAHQRNIKSCHYLGELYTAGRDVKKNTKLGIALLKFAAKNGSIPAQMVLASKYKNGVGVKRYIQSCIHYYTMASDFGNLEAKYQLGLIYLNGDGVYHDYVKAYILLKQAKDEGHAEAKRLFQDYDENDRLIDDYLKVIDMFIEVTEREMDDLCYNIGSIYGSGLIRWCNTEIIEWYTIASENGDTRADYYLGTLYENVEIKAELARKYYQKASIKGNADASFRIACMYLNGWGVTQDLLKAFEYYNKASIMGHKEASRALIILEDDDSDDDSLERDDDNTRYLDFLYDRNPHMQVAEQDKISMLENATQKGYTQLQYQLGVWYENNYDYSSALKWLSWAADIGVTDAYYRCGVFYEEGRGVDQDYSMAAKMYHKAAEKDHEGACYRLGQRYQYGNGVELDYLKAYQLYKKAGNMGHVEARKVLNITLEAKTTHLSETTEVNTLNPSSQEYQDLISMCKYVAEHGDTEAQFKVGFVYEYIILEPKYTEAVNWYSMAAKDFHREAMYHLGLLHEMGLGTSQDYQKAIHLYEQASKLGNDNALYRLGRIYHYGNGVGIDPEKAFEYYTLSAKLGNPEYQCLLGMLYEKGKLTQKSLLEALKWYTKAYLQGYDSIWLQLYAMYKDQPYEDFFFKKLFRNLSTASCGQFRLTDNYHKYDYHVLNNRLGIMCALGYGTDKDAVKAWEYFSKEYYEAGPEFGIKDILHFGYDLSCIEKGDILKALTDDEGCMNQMDRKDLCTLGKCFLQGLVQIRCGHTTIDDYDGDNLIQCLIIEKDNSRAFRCLKSASDKRDAEASALLGIMYHCGDDIDQDEEQGELCFQKAINCDIKNIEYIPTLYDTYKGKQDFKKAFKWYNRALRDFDRSSDPDQIAEINKRIQTGLGLLYEYGDGVEKDYQAALGYYKVLAKNDHPIGYHRLALVYYYGKGVSVDYRISSILFTHAAYSNKQDTGLPFVYDQHYFNESNSKNNQVYCTVDTEKLKGESHYWIGILYKNGQGVPQDHKQAQIQFKKALLYKCKRAKYEIDDYNSNI